MRHFPIYLDTRDQVIVVSGAGACALAKLRLITKTEAQIKVFGTAAEAQIETWARAGRVELYPRDIAPCDLIGATLLYAANDDEILDLPVAKLGRAAGVKTLIVDNLDQSDFITPAIVDRDPVTVAIGTEGTAPVLARKIKAEIEAMLPASTGLLARVAQAFRPMVNALPFGRARREFWSRYYFDQGPKAVAGGQPALQDKLNAILNDMKHQDAQAGHVHFVGAGPGDPELLTLKARKLLHEADMVIHDRLVSNAILELARREATMIEVGKIPFGPSWKQADINALLVKHGQNAQIVRLKSGDCGIFGRLDEEIEALEKAQIDYTITPGVTSAAAAAAGAKLSLTNRHRAPELRIITGHQANGFAAQDWRALAKPSAVAAIYMGKAAAGFMRGRLLMHGADPATPVTIVENASRTDQRIIAATLLTFDQKIKDIAGPAVILLGLARRRANTVQLQKAL